MNIEFSIDFKKELRKLSKKYPSLIDDLDTFLLTLELDPIGENILSNHIVKISGLGEGIDGVFYKVRKFICKSIAGNSSNSGIRIIYKYSNKNNIELYKIEFIEIYHKNQKSNHNIERIKKLS